MTDRDNKAWVRELEKPGPQREAALEELRAQVLRALPRGLSRWLSPNNPEFDELVEDAAQETLCGC